MSYSKLSKSEKEQVDAKIGAGSRHAQGKQLYKRTEGGTHSWKWLKPGQGRNNENVKFLPYQLADARAEEAQLFKKNSAAPTPSASENDKNEE